MKPSFRIVKENFYAYSKSMNERKQTIRDLSERKKEYLQALDSVWEQLGSCILEQNPDKELEEHAAHEVSEYSRLKRDIQESESVKSRIHNILQRIQELKETEHTEKKTKDRIQKDIESTRIELGKAVLDDMASVKLASIEPYAQTRELILSRIRELELERMQQETDDTANLFVKIGKSAKLLLNKTALSQQRRELEHLYSETGKIASGLDYSSVAPGDTVKETLDLLFRYQEELDSVTQRIKETLDAKTGEEAILKDLDDARSAQAQLTALQKKMEEDAKQLKLLCRRFGQRVFNESECFSEVKKQQAVLELCEKATVLQDSIETANTRIQKLEAEIQIILIRAEIEKLNASITAHETKIEEENKLIKELKRKIADSEHKIKELSKI